MLSSIVLNHAIKPAYPPVIILHCDELVYDDNGISVVLNLPGHSPELVSAARTEYSQICLKLSSSFPFICSAR